MNKKFRAWDLKKKEYVYSGLEFELRCLETPCKYGDDPFGSDSIGFMNIHDKYFIMEQYTGLKDKNNKEIYEGDIINYVGNYIGNYYIKYSDFNCQFVGISKNNFFYNIYKNEQKYIEVIGNIHENPELLI